MAVAVCRVNGYVQRLGYFLTVCDAKAYQCGRPMLQETCKISKFVGMKIEEAIVYCLATSNRGMRCEQIADMINRQRLHLRKDGQPVSAKQVYYVVSHNPDMFCFSLGRIMLMI